MLVELHVAGELSHLLSWPGLVRAFIDRTGTSLYGEDLPFRFGDAFGKLQVTPGRRHRAASRVRVAPPAVARTVGDRNVVAIVSNRRLHGPTAAS